jgi:hypothetical protein
LRTIHKGGYERIRRKRGWEITCSKILSGSISKQQQTAEQHVLFLLFLFSHNCCSSEEEREKEEESEQESDRQVDNLTKKAGRKEGGGDNLLEKEGGVITCSNILSWARSPALISYEILPPPHKCVRPHPPLQNLGVRGGARAR